MYVKIIINVDGKNLFFMVFGISIWNYSGITPFLDVYFPISNHITVHVVVVVSVSFLVLRNITPQMQTLCSVASALSYLLEAEAGRVSVDSGNAYCRQQNASISYFI